MDYLVVHLTFCFTYRNKVKANAMKGLNNIYYPFSQTIVPNRFIRSLMASKKTRPLKTMNNLINTIQFHNTFLFIFHNATYVVLCIQHSNEANCVCASTLNPSKMYTEEIQRLRDTERPLHLMLQEGSQDEHSRVDIASILG
jgi:ribonuclease HIII